MKKKIPLFILLGIVGYIVTFLLYFVVILFVQRPQTYTISQPTEQIEKIEICEYNHETETFSPLKELNEEEQENILHDIPTLISRKQFGGKIINAGKIVVCISYKDGSIEVLGTEGSIKIDSIGKWHLSAVYFEDDGFAKMLLKYVDEDLLPKKYLEWAAQELPE